MNMQINWCDGQILRSQPWPIVVCMNKLFKDCVVHVYTVKEGERGEVCEDSRKVVVCVQRAKTSFKKLFCPIQTFSLYLFQLSPSLPPSLLTHYTGGVYVEYCSLP